MNRDVCKHFNPIDLPCDKCKSANVQKSTLREAAQQALTALTAHADLHSTMYLKMDAIAALRAALVEDAMQKFTDVSQEIEAALAEEVQEPKPVEFDHGIGADRFRVVRGAYWWHVLIGESTAKHGKFHTQAGAEEMAALLLREFRNGAFVQHEAALAEPVQQGCDHCNSPLYAAVKCRVCGRETPIIEPEIKGDNKSDVADDLALIVRNAIAYINRLERQINELKRAAPPQRKPMTDEEIRDLWSWAMTAEAERTATTQQHAFARAIERAHGIGSSDVGT